MKHRQDAIDRAKDIIVLHLNDGLNVDAAYELLNYYVSYHYNLENVTTNILEMTIAGNLYNGEHIDRDIVAGDEIKSFKKIA